MNLNKLKGKMRECNLTQTEVAEELSLSLASFKNKLAGQTEFKASEIIQLGEILKMSDDEKIEIFLS